MIRLSLINRKKKSMDNNNHIKEITQYAKLSALYKTIIYLQEEVKKEQDKLAELKKKEDKNVG